MELKINCNAFVKLPNLLGVTSIESTISGYQYHGDTLEGKLSITGTFFDSEGLSEKPQTFTEEVPIMVIFKDDQNEVDDVQCENFNYYEVAGRGIETSFDVIVTYREKTREGDTIIEVPCETEEISDPAAETEEISFHEEPNIPEADDRLIEDLVKEHHENTEDTEEPSLTQTLNDEIKQQITTKMDIILSEKVLSKTDNFPAEKEADEVSRSFKTGKDTVKILYYKDDRMMDYLCSKHDLSIEEVLKQKKARDEKRMIIGID